jgi:hypothetical protein
MYDVGVVEGRCRGPRPPVRSAVRVAREATVAYTAAAGREPSGVHEAAWRDPTVDPGAATAAPPSLAQAVGLLDAALDALGRVDLDGEADRGLLDAAVGLQRVANRLAGAQLRVLADAERREAYTLDGAGTLASWYRARTHLDHGSAARMVRAARRLPQLPALRDALEDGRVSLGHVSAVTEAAVPTRMAAITGCEQILVDLAVAAPPRQVKIALRAIIDQVDGDGCEPQPLIEDGPDARRELWLHRSVDGLWDLRGIHDTLDGEALATVIDAFERPDPPDTPPQRRRSAAQRRADALADACRALLAAGIGPQQHGAKPHIIASVDLLQLLGIDQATLAQLTQEQRRELFQQLAAGLDLAGEADADRDADVGDRADGEPDDADAAAEGDPADVADAHHAARKRADDHDAAFEHAADVDAEAAAASGSAPAVGHRPVRTPRLRHAGEVPIATMRRLAYVAKITVVLTMGPWRVVNVGRTMRTLPAWMRAILDLVHVHCRGPDCTHKITWSQAHHQLAWDDGGDTDLNATIPLCATHHGWVTAGTWQVDFDPDTGTCTWTGPDGQIIHTHPPID